MRAATKSKTDDKKAKTNALYGKRIIMAVKQVSFLWRVSFATNCWNRALTGSLESQGGSDDPVANRMLADVIKAAKSNNVPMDVSVKEWRGGY